MQRLFILLLCASLYCSCQDKKEYPSALEITQDYYQALDNSDISQMAALLTDSLLTRETEYDYEQTFSKSEYLEWMRWDSVFNPTYEVLSMASEDSVVRATVAKIDARIRFLHITPIETEQVFSFDRGKITSIETTKYLRFNDTLFVQTRDSMVAWIKQHHPELDGYIFDQTLQGAQNYIKALKLYSDEISDE